MPTYFCRKCGMNVNANNTPRTDGCSGGTNGVHAWLKVSGLNHYYCRKCLTEVTCDIAPNTALGGGCPKSTYHAWVKR